MVEAERLSFYFDGFDILRLLIGLRRWMDVKREKKVSEKLQDSEVKIYLACECQYRFRTDSEFSYLNSVNAWSYHPQPLLAKQAT